MQQILIVKVESSVIPTTIIADLINGQTLSFRLALQFL